MHPKVLIVGTVPYNPNMTSRAFEAYFHNWEHENLAQIFSNTKTPAKGHCGTLYQITDYRMVQRWFHRIKETGVIFHYDDLPERWGDNDLELNSAIGDKAYQVGKKHTPLIYLLRGILWKKKYWCTPKLQKWLDDFRPECIFLSFSDDYFIPRIAYYVAKRYNIPVVSSIGDDYYFNQGPKTPNYLLYKSTYKALIRKVLAWKGSAIYISDKIRDKYNSEFGLDGDTVYLTSTVQRKPFSHIDTKKPLITYFGNIRMGRNQSLCEIATALGRINPEYRLEVYSNEKDDSVMNCLKENPNVFYGGSIPYEDVQKKMSASDITVIVEGTKPADIECSRYSLSTKAADALASGSAILAYGSQDCGIIEYMQSTNASVVCTKQEELVPAIQNMIENQRQQKDFYDQAIVITQQHHNLRSSCATFERVVERALSKENR